MKSKFHWLVLSALVFPFLSARAEMTHEQFDDFIELAEKTFSGMAGENHEKLEVFGLWDDPWVNANHRRDDGRVMIVIYGGLAHREEITQDALALAFCHELGHAYGGRPYKDDWNHIAAEGQADYWGANVCLGRLLTELAPAPTEVVPDPFVVAICQGERLCIRKLAAAQGLATLFTDMREQPAPRYETPDPTQVTKTNLQHPDTVQCRLDTYLAGVLGKPRPGCWYFGD